MIELEKLLIRDDSFIVEARRKVQALARDLKFDSLRTARLAICASELSRYIYHYQEPVLIIGLERINTDICLKLVFKCKKEKSGKDSLGLKIEKFFDGFKVSYTAEGFEMVEGYKYIEDPDFKLTQEFVHLEKEKLLRLSKSDELIALIDQVKREKVRVEELKKLDQLKSDFVSIVSHELRTPLTVTREAISQMFDGICGEINEDQKQFLSISIEGIDRLSRLIENLLDISKIEAQKIKLKRELIDIVSLAKGVSSSFAAAFQSKGLETKYNFSKDKIELFVDKDRIIQVFVNLMSNALKFTPAGSVGISIVEKEDVVECEVSDTGLGISDEDLPKAFGKFEQFGRDYESAEKGTGLGLAISKGIIELHRGKIWVESKLGQGAKISFTLPKYSPKELFKGYVNESLAEVIKEGASLSIIVFEVKNYDALKKKYGQDKTASIMHSLWQRIKTGLRYKSDISVEDSQAIFVALPETDKKGVWATAERLRSSFDDYLSREGLAKEIEVDLRAASFPEDASIEEEFLNKVKL